jgi:hypothetical protein
MGPERDERLEKTIGEKEKNTEDTIFCSRTPEWPILELKGKAERFTIDRT